MAHALQCPHSGQVAKIQVRSPDVAVTDFVPKKATAACIYAQDAR